MKYSVPNNEREVEILPNHLDLASIAEIENSEFEGFYKSEKVFTENLTDETLFNLEYIKNIHETALGHLYNFAGKYRNVNLEKEGFKFPSAKYLEINMIEFEKEILLKLPHVYKTKSILIKNIAMVHAELLFIHPFREGNGRVARILANMMSYKAGYNKIKFEELEDNILLQKKYIEGVQFAGIKDYKKMESIIKKIF